MSRKPPLLLPHGTEAAWRAAEQRGDAGYLDPATGLFVMTGRGLRGRGTCCGNACRHCPYDWRSVSDSQLPPQTPPSIEVVDHDPAWAERFQLLRAALLPALGGIALRIEHVGSTSVPGLAAKPVIDVDVILERASDTARVIAALESLGYRHLGDLGIPGREALRHPSPPVRHNLYAGAADALPIQNHLAFRDALRSDPALRDEYAALKRRLAATCPNIDAYVEAKTELIIGVLKAAGLGPDRLAEITQVNRADPQR